MQYLTVTVLALDTYAKKVPFAGIEPVGTPNAISSPSRAPVTEIVKLLHSPGGVSIKSNVAELDNTEGIVPDGVEMTPASVFVLIYNMEPNYKTKISYNNA